jgi:hypothetical protein
MTRGKALATTVALLGLASCSKLLGTSGDRSATALPSYPDGIAGLTALFSDVLSATRKDDRERVHDLLASTRLSDAELDVVLGEAAPRVRSRYHALMESLANRGAVELVAQVYERHYDAVEILEVDPHAPTASEGDRAAAQALKVPLKLYAARLKRAGETRGLRYDLFFYLNGHWRTLNQLGKALAEDAAAPRDGGQSPTR